MKFFAICLLGLFACGQGGRPAFRDETVKTPPATNKEGNATQNNKVERNMTEETHIKRLTLTAKAEKTQDALVIDYEVQNQTNDVLYVWDRMPDYPDNGPQIISPDLAYVFFEDGKTLRVTRANLEPPKRIRVASKETPYLKALQGGAKATGRIKLKLPVDEFSPYYGSPSEENSEPAEASEIRLQIGWTDFREGMKLEEATVGGEKVFVISGAWPKPYQRIAEQRIAMKVPVRVAKEDFERTPVLQ